MRKRVLTGAFKKGAKNEEEFWKMFSENVANRRMQLNLTQQWVSNRVGIVRSSYNRVEKGKRHVSVWDLQMIAKALCVPASDLIPKIPLAD